MGFEGVGEGNWKKDLAWGSRHWLGWDFRDGGRCWLRGKGVGAQTCSQAASVQILATWPWGMIPNKKRPEQSAGHLDHLRAGCVRTRNPPRGLGGSTSRPRQRGSRSWRLTGLLYGGGVG